MKLLLPEVGADQHWPYGLVGDEKSYARQVDGNFFADVKNSSFFLKALKEDAGEKQVDADAHLNSIDRKATEFMKGGSNRQRKIVDREAFIKALKKAVCKDGLLTLVLGGKSVGKSLVVSYVADKVRQAQGSSRTVVLANLRRGGEADFYQAVFGAAAEQQGLAEKLPSLFKEVVTMASGLVAAAENLNAATAPLAASVRSIIGIMQPEQKALTFSKLVKSIQETGNNTAIIIGRSEPGHSPMTATMPKQRQPRLLWLRSPAKPRRPSQPRSSSSAPSTATPSSWPRPVSTWSISRTFSSLRKCRRSTCSRCSPTTGAWGRDWRASSWPPTAVLLTQSTPLWAT